jgi:hypothetical protein
MRANHLVHPNMTYTPFPDKKKILIYFFLTHKS